MIDFLLIRKGSVDIVEFRKANASWQSIQLSEQFILYTDSENIYQTSNLDYKLILIGDFWNTDSIQDDLSDILKLNKKVKGNYYGFIFNSKSVKVFSNLFNILPVYYSVKYKLSFNSFEFIKLLNLSEKTIDKRFILESVLFNYPFFDSTIYQEIKLLKTHHHLEFTSDVILQHKHFSIENLFVPSPLKGSNVYSKLTNLFIERVEQYYSNTNSAITFTSGFDGRTLVSCASYFKKVFYTLSFGRESNDDVLIPKKNAEELGIIYKHIDCADIKYLEEHYLNCSEEMIQNSGGYNGFLYPHFLYIAKRTAETSKDLITGYCGSEIFRAFHLTGAINSEALVNLFTMDDKNLYSKKLKDLINLRVLNLEEFKDELDSLIKDLFEYKYSLPDNLTLNQKYYTFVFNEIFRKTFGFWISSQMKYLNVRVPFLDFNFLSEFLRCDLAGVNNAFFTDNPFKRFKGQLLYSFIIKKTNNIIFKQLTGKGYKPSDLITPFGKLNIAIHFFRKRLQRKFITQNIDNLGIISGILSNKIVVSDLIRSSSLFNKSELLNILNKFDAQMSENERDVFLSVLSILRTIK